MKGGEPDAVFEISPLLATSAQRLKERFPRIEPIRPGGTLYLE
jgi:hypothetical protein